MVIEHQHSAHHSAMPLSDVLVAGGGPAGLRLAAEVAIRGLKTTVVAPGLGETWDRSYGVFAKDVADSELGEAVKRIFSRPLIRVSGHEPIVLSESYLRFDTGALQSLLFERAARAGVQFLAGTVGAVTVDASSRRTMCSTSLEPGPGDAHTESRPVQLEAKLVVNASGGALRDPGAQCKSPRGYQSAYGQWVELPEHPFSEGEMSLMDYRPSDRHETNPSGPPSFLYAMPETGSDRGPGTVFVQETTLVGELPVPMSLLRERLVQRLDQMGLRPTRTLGTERCVIPLGGALPEKNGVMLPFGAAAGFVHPATGYQLAMAFQLAPLVANIIYEHLPRDVPGVVSAALEEMWPDRKRKAYRLYELGATTLATLSPAMMEEFIFDFFSLTGGRWQRFMAGTMESGEIAETMWCLFKGARGPLRNNLLRAGTSVSTRLLLQIFNHSSSPRKKE